MRDRKMFLLHWSHASVNITKAALVIYVTYVICDNVFFLHNSFFGENKYENNSSKITDTEWSAGIGWIRAFLVSIQHIKIHFLYTLC